MIDHKYLLQVLKESIKQQFPLPEIFAFLDIGNSPLVLDSDGKQKNGFTDYIKALQNNISINIDQDYEILWTMNCKVQLYHDLILLIQKFQQILGQRMREFIKIIGQLMLFFGDSKRNDSIRILLAIQRNYFDYCSLKVGSQYEGQEQFIYTFFIWKLSYLCLKQIAFPEFLTILNIKDEYGIGITMRIVPNDQIIEKLQNYNSGNQTNFCILNEAEIIENMVANIFKNRDYLQEELMELRQSQEVQNLVESVKRARHKKVEALRMLRELFNLELIEKTTSKPYDPQKNRIRQILLFLYLKHTIEKKIIFPELISQVIIYSNQIHKLNMQCSDLVLEAFADNPIYEEVNTMVNFKQYLELNDTNIQQYSAYLSELVTQQQLTETFPLYIYKMINRIYKAREDHKEQLIGAFQDQKLDKTILILQTKIKRSQCQDMKFLKAIDQLLELQNFVSQASLQIVHEHENDYFEQYMRLKEAKENSLNIKKLGYLNATSKDKATIKQNAQRLLKMILDQKKVFPDLLRFFNVLSHRKKAYKDLSHITFNFCNAFVMWMESDAELQEFLRECIDKNILHYDKEKQFDVITLLDFQAEDISLSEVVDQRKDSDIISGLLKAIYEQREIHKSRLIELFQDPLVLKFRAKIEQAAAYTPKPFTQLYKSLQIMRNLSNYVKQQSDK